MEETEKGAASADVCVIGGTSMQVELEHVQAMDYNMHSSNGYKYVVEFDDVCPVCNYGIDMSKGAFHNFHDVSEEEQKNCKVACIHLCPHCHSLFITEHKMKFVRNEDTYIPDYYVEESHSVYPITAYELNVSDEIQRVSQSFKNIYNQALLAKQYGLGDIYGMALRKALECLVKDFALFNNPDKEDEIAKKSLANCIKDYIESSKINTLCTSCRLIGNNETHWHNENTAEDVVFMEKVLNAILHFIEQEVIVSDAEAFNAKKIKSK